MKITILGSGYSMGVPTIGCDCGVCKSKNPKNKRRRASIYIEVDGVRLLIDTSPDLRAQALDNNIRWVDGVLFTHEHSDHIAGIDDLRAFSVIQEQKIDIYSDRQTISALKKRLPYLFKQPLKEWGWYKLCLNPHIIKAGKKFAVKGIEILPFYQTHGVYKSLGYRVGNVAYSTDVSDFTSAQLKKLKGLDLWIVDCQAIEGRPKTHSYLEKTLGWIKEAKPKRAVLIHMNHEVDYDAIKKMVPKNVEPAYDNMVIKL